MMCMRVRRAIVLQSSFLAGTKVWIHFDAVLMFGTNTLLEHNVVWANELPTAGDNTAVQFWVKAPYYHMVSV